MKSAVNRIWTMVVLLLSSLCAQTSGAQPASNPAVADEFSKQTGIYQSRGQDVPEGYVIHRSLLSYLFTLPSGFSRSLANLGPNDRWLDIGAGEGRAILDYCTSKYDVMLMHGLERHSRKAKAIAISIEDRRTSQWHKTAASFDDAMQIQYFSGRSLREYSLDELGQFQVISDVFGGFSYTRDLSLFMQKSLGFLKLNGSFYTVLQDVRSEKGTNRPYYPESPFLTEIANPDGSAVSVCSWLKSITCAEVTCELKSQSSPPVEVYHIRKVCDNVSVPGLVPVHFTAGTPPERGFKVPGATPR